MLAKLRILFDNFTLILIAVIVTASLLPAHGQGALVFEWITAFAIALLFFLHGSKLSRSAIIAGAMHWRLHLLVFACTFILFPILMLGLQPVLRPLLGDELWVGMLYLSALPGTVQSAIAFTSMARGNIPAAVCNASASSLVGILVTPLLVKILLDADAGTTGMLEAVLKISVQLLLPFIAGHLMRRWIGDWIDRNRNWLKNVDQGSILLVVYTAFSAAVVGGLWSAVPPLSLLLLTVVCSVILAIVLWMTTTLARRLHFNKEDEITIVFCGSKKSMATGVPMAQVLFAGGAVGPAILPLMIFHQIQLMVCAVMAQHYAKRENLPED
ncbi:bile acid:sodium symporter [Thiopseudomonas alkaliphila]|uniref:Bile acid:sodium symporter n=1 Tax=Thiopseudomonas alkaliphila TaxID=1697053 RepID=A0A0K1XEJ8_9GAMM|nr:bile acid:sodium symporter [Thiopseudomonas alkaliphila]AKX51056.1 bile acid:sodium symporter [Thiopseudomonas alkaliphila]AKX57423.1 bile acid:sodium symporter [Thiopseudomonas alkaliphila]AKX59679.1 bile acid:sodium symporter [Thiopseudomonas alkaliphila]